MNRIQFAVKSALGLTMMTPVALVYGQAAPAPSSVLEEVVVTGIRYSLEAALETKRAADSSIDVVTSEDIGKMPDKNIADSLQRVPGVTISSEGATEGGFDENDRVSMRGTGPSLTQTLINGHNVASGDWFVLDQVTTVGRSVSYTLLPSELVDTIVVHKSSEASLVEGGVAGSVDIITRKPLDFKQPLTFEASAGGVYADLPSKSDPQLSALFNWHSDESNFGVMLQGFSETRHLRRDGNEILGYLQFAPGSKVAISNPDLTNVWYPNDIGAAFFTQERKRNGGLIDVEWKPNDAMTFDLSGFMSQLTATNVNYNYLLWTPNFINSQSSGSPGQAPLPGYVITNGTLTKASFAGVPGTEYGIYDQISRPNESATSNFFNLDGNFRVNDRLTVAGQVGISTGHGRTPTQDVSETGPDIGGGASFQLNGISAGPSYSLGATNNATPFAGGKPVAFGWIFGAENIDVKDKEVWGKLDATYAMPDTGAWKDLKFGVRYTNHDRTSDQGFNQGPTFSGPNGGGTSTANYPATFSTYPSNYTNFGGSMPTGMWYWTPAQLAVYNGPGLTQRNPIARAYYQDYFDLHENDLATYLQADFKGEGWSANVGIRVVNSQEDVITYSGNAVSASTPGAITTSLFGPYVGIPVNNTYSDFLPSANLKLDVAKDVVVRFAVSETMTRADYSALAGPTNLSGPPPIGGTGSGSASNPNLEPIRSINYDAGFEWYFAKRSLLSAAVYYMDLKNFIGYGTETLSYLTFGSQYPQGAQIPYQLTVPINVEGRVQGIEVAYQQAFGDHFGAAVNYTITDGRQTTGIVNGDDRLVGTSKNTYNISGYYEDSRFSARLTYNFRSAFYAGLDRSTAFTQDDTGSLAASLGCKINDTFSVTLDGQNLTDPTLKYYALNTDQPRAFYKNGRQYYLNLRAKF